MTASDAELPPAVEPAVLANGAGDAPAPAVTAKDARAPRRGRGREDRPAGRGSRRRRARGGGRAARLDARAPAAVPKAWAKGDRVSALATFDRTYHPADVIDVRPVALSGDSPDEARLRVVLRAVRGRQAPGRGAPGSALEPYTSAVEEALRREAGRVFSARGRRGHARAPRRGLTRNLKRRYNEINNVAGAVEDLAPMDQKLEKEHDERTKVKNVKVIECGKHEVDAWYFSPYPRDARRRERRRRADRRARIDARRPAATPSGSGAPPPPTWSATSCSCASGA